MYTKIIDNLTKLCNYKNHSNIILYGHPNIDKFNILLEIFFKIADLRSIDLLSGYLLIDSMILFAADIAFLLGPSGFSLDANLITFFKPYNF